MASARAFLGTLLRAARAWSAHNAAHSSAALAFFLMLSLAPLLIAVTATAGFLFESDSAQQYLVAQAGQVVGPEGAAVVRQILRSSRFDRHTSLWTGIASFVGILVSASMGFVQLQSTLDRIWSTQREQPLLSVVKRVLIVRLLSLVMVMAAVALLFALMVTAAAVRLVRERLAVLHPGLDIVAIAADAVLTFSLMGLLFMAMFRLLPHARVPPRAAWIGGFSTALLLAAGNHAIAFYLGNFAGASAYGAAGSLVMFLLWVYYSLMVFLFGAELTHALGTTPGTDD